MTVKFYAVVIVLFYLWVLHDALDAVEVGEFIDGFVAILQQPPDSLSTDRQFIWVQLNSLQPSVYKLQGLNSHRGKQNSHRISHKGCEDSTCAAVYVRKTTSNSLKALSHSFCPAACWVQSVISWLILSVTALKHTHIHPSVGMYVLYFCVIFAPAAGACVAGPQLWWTHTAHRRAEFAPSLCSALLSTDRP